MMQRDQMNFSPPLLLRSCMLTGRNSDNELKSNADIWISDEKDEQFEQKRKSAQSRPVFMNVVNDGDADRLADSLQASVKTGADGIFLTGRLATAELQKIEVLLCAQEVKLGKTPGQTALFAVADHPSSIVALQRASLGLPRIMALGGPGPGLKAALNISDDNSAPLIFARAMTVLCASIAGVPAIAGPEPELTDEAFRSACLRDRRDGFVGKMVRNEAEVSIANQVFGS